MCLPRHGRDPQADQAHSGDVQARRPTRDCQGPLYYEICEEPYFGGVAREWQHRIIEMVVDTEEDLTNKHLISLNIANGKRKVEKPQLGGEPVQLQYAHPPEIVPFPILETEGR